MVRTAYPTGLSNADSLVVLLASDGDLHRYELEYWACWGASETDEQWRISPLLRQHVSHTSQAAE